MDQDGAAIELSLVEDGILSGEAVDAATRRLRGIIIHFQFAQ
jgi:hypothetical protein